MFEINCPFCNGKSVSDVIDSIEQVNGQWECSNGHQFTLQYIRKMDVSRSCETCRFYDIEQHWCNKHAEHCSSIHKCNSYEPREDDND